MSALSPADLKRRWRVASRFLLSDLRGGEAARKHPDPRKRTHLVDGEWVERLPFNANGPFALNTPGPGSWVVQAEPVLSVDDGQSAAEETEQSWCSWTFELICRCKRN